MALLRESGYDHFDEDQARERGFYWGCGLYECMGIKKKISILSATIIRKSQEISVDDMKWNAEHGDSKAELSMGKSYLYGFYGFPKSMRLAEMWLHRAAAQGESDAVYRLGWIYFVQEQYDEAITQFMRVVDVEHEKAQFAIATMAYSGFGMEKNFDKSFKWFSEASKNGNGNATSNIGIMYIRGQGVKKCRKTGVKWLKKASDKCSWGAYNYGISLITGVAGVMELEKGEKMLRKAAMDLEHIDVDKLMAKKIHACFMISGWDPMTNN